MNVYVAGSKPEYQVIEAMLKEQGHEVVPEISIAEVVAVVPVEDWPADADILTAINMARRQNKRWVVLDLRMKDFFERVKTTAPPRRRQVTLEKRVR